MGYVSNAWDIAWSRYLTYAYYSQPESNAGNPLRIVRASVAPIYFITNPIYVIMAQKIHFGS